MDIRGSVTAWWQGTRQRSRNLAARLARRLGLSLALLVVIATGTLAQLAAAGVGLAPVASAHGRTSAGTPNHFDPRQTHEPSPAAST